MLWGISWTFSSGADVAWITDELNEPDRIHLVLARTARRQFIGAGIGIVLFAVLAAVSGRHQAIVIAGIAMLALGLLVAVTFPERGFTPTRTHRFRAAASITRDGARIVIRDHVILLLVLATFVVNGAADVLTRVYPARLESLGFPTNSIGTIWFGALSIVGFIAGWLALLGVERRVAHQSGAKAAMLLACGFGAVGLGISPINV